MNWPGEADLLEVSTYHGLSAIFRGHGPFILVGKREPRSRNKRSSLEEETGQGDDVAR